MKRNFTYIPVIGAAFLMLAGACTTEEASPGVEYMPDMYRSPAIEAYVDYGQDPYYHGEEKAQEQRETPSARKPVDGTIPFSMDADKAWINFPYAYPNTPAGYDSAGASLMNPLPLTEANFNKGKDIFKKYCVHCHGKEGKGDGAIPANGNFPPIPAYDGIAGLTEGKMFHTITFGKGNMGSHASQLNKEERWQVIWYVKSLQTGQKFEDMKAAQDTIPAAVANMDMTGIAASMEQITVDGQIYFKDPDGNYYNISGAQLTEEEVNALGVH